MGTLNQAQMAFGKRLVERMSSIIIDQECIDCLIELVGYKIKQKLTLKQRRLLSKQQKKKKKSSTTGKKTTKRGGKGNDISDEDDDSNDEDYEEEEDEDEQRESSLNVDEDEEEFLEDEDDPEANNANNDSKSSSASSNDRILLRHIDDDGEKGLKLLNMILMIHSSYQFNTPATYQKLFTFVSSRKDNISSYTLKLLGTYYAVSTRGDSSTKNKEHMEAYNSTSEAQLDKLKHFCTHGKPKQAKHAVHLIFKNFEKPKNEQILSDLYKVCSSFFNLNF
jgi:hypothetical protein